MPSLGAPLVKDFEEGPAGLEAYTWEILWDEDGIAYLGRDRLWKWDGVNMTPLGPDSFTFLRAMAFDREGKLLLGGVNQFGRYDPERDTYESLLPLLPPEERGFGEAWVVHDDGDAIWLGVTHKLYRIDASGTQVFSFEGRHRIIFHFLESGVFAHETGVGLWRIDLSTKVIVAADDSLKEVSLMYLEQREKSKLLGFSNIGRFEINISTGEVIHERDAFKLKNLRFSSIEKLSDYLYAFGTLEGGVYIYNFEQNYTKKIVDCSLVVSVQKGPKEELWVGSSDGIIVSWIGLSIGLIDIGNGLPSGLINKVTRKENITLVSSSRGVVGFRDFSSGNRHVNEISEISNFSHFFLGGGYLYDNYNVLLSWTEADGVQEVASFDGEIWTFTGIGDQWICISFSDHIGIYGWEGDRLREAGRLPLGAAYREMEADETGRIWGWGPSRSLLELRVSVEGEPIPRFHRDGAGQAIEGTPMRVGMTGTGPVLVHERGLLVWEAGAEAWEAEAVDWGYGLPLAVDFERVGTELLGWMVFWDQEIGSNIMMEVRRAPGEPVQTRILPWVDMTELGRIHLLEVSEEPARRFHIGGVHGLLVADASLPEEIAPPRKPILYQEGRQLKEGLRLTKAFGEPVPPFTFASPGSGMTYPIRFETRLRGRDSAWSGPSPFPLRELGTVREGSYAFEVRAVDPFGRTSEATGISLKVLPPWHRLMAARIAGLLLLGAGGYLAYWYGQRRSKRRAALLERTVNERTYELKRANEFKDDFIASLSHEIRNPLNGVIGSIEQLKADEPVPGRSLKALRGAAGYLKNSVEDMLDFDKVQSGHNPVEEAAFDLREVVDGVLEIYRSRARAKGLTLAHTIRIPEEVWIVSDLKKVQQIIGNLAGNAVKFTESGRVTVGVIVEEMEAQRRGTLRLWVEDTGPGIPAGEREAIFDKFYRARRTTRETEGTGLGLALVRRFVEALEGTLELTSETGKGSLFQVNLPLKLCPARTPAETDSSLNLDGLAVLIVEDLEYNRVALEDFLREHGCQVDSAENGNDGFAKACTGSHRVIFLDWELPGMNGPEISRSLRDGDHLAAGTLIVGMTAFATPDVREKCLQAGMDYFITKPISREQLARVLEPFARHAALFEGWGLLAEMADKADRETKLDRWVGYLDTHIEEVRKAIREGSTENSRKAAHRLLGHLRMIKVARIPDLLGDLLTAAASGEMRDVLTEWRTVESLLVSLRKELREIKSSPNGLT